MQTPVRFSSCRGVAFEIKPHADPFAAANLTQNDPHGSSKKSWFPWYLGSSSKVFPNSSYMQKSVSRTSSHFCDLDLDEDDEDENKDDIIFESLEEGQDEEKDDKPVLPSASKREQIPKPARKQESRLSVILLDQGLFTVYKRLFVVCFTLNIIGLVLAAAGHFPYARNRAALFSIANILALTLSRSEAFLRVVFWLAVKVLGKSWVPLPIKTATTSLLQSLGGIHSSCGISSVAWLIYALILTLKDRENTSPEIIGVASTILSLLCLTCLVWAFIVLTISYDPVTKSYSKELGSRLVQRQEFWFTIAITILIITPWSTVRRVPVNISVPSGHASIIKFEGGIKSGILGRISPSPLSEWHAFGIISDGKTEHMMLAGAVGDFTKSLVSNPPSHLWVRKLHFAGLPYLVNMYDRVLVVQQVRGSACFCRSCCSHARLMYAGHPKEKVIVHDTAVLGRPNVSQMSVDTAKRWGADVVIVTSNPEGSRDVVNACKAAGIPAFGPIWDS
ncbi:LOW QUALITY PROTEIN: adenylate-forming reductase 03009 [Gossypium arboreum]|uniref:LOW QUALITY PROTEIN: adenylate-forming reductase 03009 n=1 Tax=Gossypium arboreum TaxID=29729 RepID=UPI0008192214|nr:LOW QUALITY PROTEIN: adenylate-forming reductase 03009 [Gossypium arboreum]